MTWEEISRLAQRGEPLPDDAMLHEQSAYFGLHILYEDLRRHKDTDEKSRIRYEAELLKGEFLRQENWLEKLIVPQTAYNLMKAHPDAKCSEILQMVNDLAKEMEENKS